MYTVFQGETGGYFDVPYTGVTAISGYVLAFGNKTQYFFDGVVQSGILSISNSGFSRLPFGEYTVLPQITDSEGLLYFLDETDLEVIEVPDYPQSLLLPSADDVIDIVEAYTDAQIALEVAARIALSGFLQDQIDTLSTTIVTVSGLLHDEIVTISGLLHDQILAVDAVNDADLEALSTTLTDAYRSADTTLSGVLTAQITSEASQRSAADTVLANANAATSTRVTTLSGQLQTHISDTANPHDVTAAQVGALTESDGDARYWQLTTDIATQSEFDIALSGHIAASDPHPQYLRQSEADALYSALAHTHAFIDITSTPTTLAGYGITDGYTKTEQDARYWQLTTDLATQAELNSAIASLVPNSRSLTINGVGQDLSADRIWTVGDAVKASNNVFTGQNAFGANAAIGSSSFFGSGYYTVGMFDQVFNIDVSALYYLEGVAAYITVDPTTDSSIQAYAMDAEVKTPVGNTKAIDSLTGVYGSAYHNGTGAANTIRGLQFYAGINSNAVVNIQEGIAVGNYNNGGVVTTQNGAHIDNESYSGAIINTRRILYLTNYTDSATIANDYGIWMSAVNAGSTLNYAIWTDGGEVRHKAGAAGVVPLSLQLASTPTADAFRILASDGTTKLTYFDTVGDLFLPTKTANTVFAGPTTGSAARPTWRTLVAADIPDLSDTYQSFSSELSAIAFLGPTGVVQRTGPGAWTAGNITQGSVIGLVSALAALQPLDSDLTTLAGLTATTDNFLVSVASAWASRTPAQVRTTLALVPGTNVQAWDADLDAIAALTTTSFGRSLLTQADASALRTTAGLGTAATQNLTVTGAGTLATGGFTLTVPATGTVALLAVSNLFTLRQDVRADGSAAAAGVYAPWVTGDALPAIRGGAVTAGNNQIGILGESNSGYGVRGSSISNYGVAAFVTPTGTITTQLGMLISGRSSGTPSTNFGVALDYFLQTDTTPDQSAARIAALWSTATHGSRTSAITFSVVNNAGALTEVGRWQAGSSPSLTLSSGTRLDFGGGQAVIQNASAYFFRLTGTGTLSFADNTAANIQSVAGGGLFGIGNVTPAAQLHVRVGTTTANAVKEVMRLETNVTTASTGSSAGFGPQLTFYGESATDTTMRQMADWSVSWVTATDVSRAARLVANVWDTAAREALRLEASGSAAMIGFLGANASVRTAITGSRSDGTALSNLLSELATKGLITDSSSAVAAGNMAHGRPKTGVTSAVLIPGVEATGVGTVTLTANQVRYEQIYVKTTITIDQLICEVTAGGAGGTTIRLGIYNADVDLQPTSLVYDAGTVTADSIAVKTLSLGAAQTLTPGRYLLSMNSDGTPTIRVLRAGSMYTGYSASFGASPFVVSMSVAQTYGAFPSTGLAWTALGTGGGSAAQHGILCHISTP